jgi:hypothetical protein
MLKPPPIHKGCHVFSKSDAVMQRINKFQTKTNLEVNFIIW